MIIIYISVVAALAATVQGYNQPVCQGDRTVIVHLFNWKWTDIAAECERFLGPRGFCGVQVSPPNEHRVITNPNRPWWERYQPISYKLVSRSGNEQEFADMVSRCNAVGVYIYVDMVVNHMCGAGGTGHGSGGSYFDANQLNFPGVPFGPTDFNCCHCSKCTSGSCDIESYGDKNQVRNCRLVSLLDLDLSKDYVRGKIADYFNHLIALGVAGFRVDACKHMWPGDMEAFYAKVTDLNTQWFPGGTKPFIFNEVIDMGGEAISSGEYTHLGRITEFKFCMHIGSLFRGQNQLKHLVNWGEGWGMLPSDKALVFVDNHDNQRGHGGGGNILTFYDNRQYKMATAFKLAHPYGFVRIMSSYSWDGGPHQNDWIGPPHNGDMSIKTVGITSDGTCDDRWVCEHRWRQIFNMVKFRNVAGYEPLRNWWDNGNNQIAFSRGDKAFIVINNDNGLDRTLQTGLSAGTYCDVISGEYTGSSCTGTSINVDGSGNAHFSIPGNHEDGVIAIHVSAKLGATPPDNTVQPPGSTLPPGPTTPPPEGYQRTVVFIKFQSNPGQDLFIRGGINHERRPGCSNDAGTSPCALSITHNSLGTTAHYAKHNSWRVGDNKLDWYGAESGQGSHSGQRAEGSPSAWTSNSQSSSGYQPLNKYGDHYWMVDVNMNCNESEDGWFEFKALATNLGTNGGWEFDINQSSCTGSVGGTKPYTTNNHMGRCGFVNVFTWNGGDCRIENF